MIKIKEKYKIHSLKLKLTMLKLINRKAFS